MFCPGCGKEVEFDYFCPHCGYKIYSHEPTPIYESVSSKQAHHRKPKNVALTAFSFILCALIVASVSFVAIIDSNENTKLNPELSPIYIENLPGNTGTITAYGDFIKGIVSAEFNDEGLMFTLSDEVSSEYNRFEWRFTNLHYTAMESSLFGFSKYSGQTLYKTEPVLTWLNPTVGEYGIKVECYNTANGNSATYSGTIFYDDIIEEKYYWTYDGVTYSMEISYEFSEYLEYSYRLDSNLYVRSGGDYSQMTRLCEINEVIEDMADKLKKSYLSTYGSDASLTNQGFAEFILTFVNTCFDYPPYTNNPDGYVYGSDEYWAYPMELIYYGMGDCEDTSILCASLFKVCGYDAAILLVPGHATAAVALDDYEAGEVNSAYRVSLFYQEIDGKTYYACETTLDTNRYGIGYLSSSYTYDETGYYYNNTPYVGNYGFHTL